METYQCVTCEGSAVAEYRNHRYVASGMPNVILQSVEYAECPKCGDSQVIIPHILKVHRAIALALLKSPRLLTGPQFAFLRQHVELSRETFAKYLGVEVEDLLKWEREEVPIGQSVDRLVRLLVVELDQELAEFAPSVVSRLTEISNISGKDLEVRVDVNTLTSSYFAVQMAA